MDKIKSPITHFVRCHSSVSVRYIEFACYSPAEASYLSEIIFESAEIYKVEVFNSRSGKAVMELWDKPRAAKQISMTKLQALIYAHK